MELGFFLQGSFYLSFLISILAFIVVLSVIVFIHEYGHFQVGRWFGVKIEAFSIGFGKELIGYTDRHGTRWKICPWPIGGYVKFEGDANAASMTEGNVQHSPTSLHAKPVWQRALIVAAGPFANFILAIAIFSVAFMIMGKAYVEPKVGEVKVGSAAAQAGILPGDYIRSIDGTEASSFSDLQRLVWFKAGRELIVVVERQGEKRTLTLVPSSFEESDNFGGKISRGVLGVSSVIGKDALKITYFSPGQAIIQGCKETWGIATATVEFIGNMISGRQSVRQIGGAASIAKGAGDAVSNGTMNFVIYIAFLSVSIGLINLFPIPMLDGGHLVFYALEALRGKPLGPHAQEWGFRIGLSFVVMLMLVGVVNDGGRIFNVVFGT